MKHTRIVGASAVRMHTLHTRTVRIDSSGAGALSCWYTFAKLIDLIFINFFACVLRVMKRVFNAPISCRLIGLVAKL